MENTLERSRIAAGYLSPAYPRSLAEFGAPRLLPRCRGWLLERDIPGSGARDAMGPYPLFACRDWAGLAADLDDLGAGVVSVAIVPDPFGDHDPGLLQRCFDRVLLFKDRYVTDLRVPAEEIGTRHHRYYARKALAAVAVEHCPDAPRFADEWTALYARLIQRHGLRGIQAFSPKALAEQLGVPGAVLFRAVHEGRGVGMHLWYVQGAVAYSHLTALCDTGYHVGASYALYAFALDWFRPRLRWLDLGAGAGTTRRLADGLDRFKRGWATGARPTYFCARVCDREKYAQLVRARGNLATSYFPEYREG